MSLTVPTPALTPVADDSGLGFGAAAEHDTAKERADPAHLRRRLPPLHCLAGAVHTRLRPSAHRVQCRRPRRLPRRARGPGPRTRHDQEGTSRAQPPRQIPAHARRDRRDAILLVEGTALDDRERTRDALNKATCERVKAIARARLNASPHSRATRVAALRDLCLILLLGEQGLRSAEARSARSDAILTRGPAGSRPWLHVTGKGSKLRELPLATETAEALVEWEEVRPPEPDGDPLLLPRLGRPRHEQVNGWDSSQLTVPRAGGQLSGQGLSDIVKPIMLAAGVSADLAHPHVLRHTYGSLYMTHPHAELSRLQRLMVHASPETTAVYVHHDRQALEDDLAEREREPSALQAAAHRRRQRWGERVA